MLASGSVGAASGFSSVKLASGFVSEAKRSGQVMRRSAAGQIEYWAMLGKALEEGGLTTRDATLAISEQDRQLGRQTGGQLGGHVVPVSASVLTALDDIEAPFAQADASGSLNARLCEVVQGNRDGAPRQQRAA